MENTLILTQLSTSDFRRLLREELEGILVQNPNSNKSDADEIGGIDLAVEVTGKAKPTIYNLVHERLLPHSKQGGKLYFSRKELTEWVRSGRRKTQTELAIEAETFSPNNSR